MAQLDWSEGFRKVSKKARRGRKQPKTIARRSHRIVRPSEYDATRSLERRRRIADLRAAETEEDLEDAC